MSREKPVAKSKHKPADGGGVVSVASNRRAFHDYEVLEQFEAGIVLVGTEVKSLRNGHCQLVSAYARVEPDKDIALLISAEIPEYKNAGPLFQHAPQRDRRLLLHKREMASIRNSLRQKGTTLIPLRVYFKDGRAKVLLGVCRGKHDYDKRNVKKERDIKRQLSRYKG